MPSQMRRIAVACEDTLGLQGRVSSHFGKCPAFMIAEVESGELGYHRVITNPYYLRHKAGAIPRFLDHMGIKAVLAGNMGSRAQHILERYGIETAIGYQGHVKDAIQSYLTGDHPNGDTCQCTHDCDSKHDREG